MEVDQINSSSLTEEEVDSEAEEDRKEYEKQKFEFTFDLKEGSIADGSIVLVCNRGCPQALTRIIFAESCNNIGNATTKGKDDKEAKEVLTVTQ